MLFSACGPVTAGGQGSAASAAIATMTRTPAVKVGSAALNGCPVSQPSADAAAFVPDVTVSGAGGEAEGPGQPVTLARGQRLEIRLSPGVRWNLAVTDPSHVLALVNPEGWYSPQLKACVWRFTAVAAGSAQLAFDGSFVCLPHSQCVTTEIAQAYDVTVR
jgi:hypothetical protein